MSLPLRLKIGTRSSQLALAQVEEFQKLISQTSQNLEFEIVKIKTSGDKIQDRNLADIGGKALFIKELEEALVKKDIDLALHSAKDVPPFIHPETEIIAFTPRLDPRDCFISAKYSSISQLPQGATIGTSSPRRKAILLYHRPDLKIVDFRGNVTTRIRKVSEKLVDGSIIAYCGLSRINNKDAIKEIIPTDFMLPAGGQGALAVQIRKGWDISRQIAAIDHFHTQICIKSERSFLRNVGANCYTPVSIHAFIEGKQVRIKSIIYDRAGTDFFELSDSCEIDLQTAIQTASKMAEITKKNAAHLLEEIVS